MNGLPESYYLSVALLLILMVYTVSKYKKTWSAPFAIVLFTTGTWYLIEPFYSDDFFYEIDQRYMGVAFNCVLLFLVSFTLITPFALRIFSNESRVDRPTIINVSAQRILAIIFGIWLILLAYGTSRMQGNLLGALFPIDGRNGANMWSRQAGIDAGSGGFIVSSASYLYVLCLACFGLLFPLLPRGKYQIFAIILILISWPYAVLQGSRNIALAAFVPFVISYLLYSRQMIVIKFLITSGMAVCIELVMRLMIDYRNVGFLGATAGNVSGVKHLGLNMASELVFCTKSIVQGELQISYGRGYLFELFNIIPRAIWSDKPYVGIDYAIARGFGSISSDIGVFATISTGMIGGGVLNFGIFVGPIIVSLLMSIWVALLTRFRVQGTPLRRALFLLGIGVTFNLGRDITLLVLWPMIFAYTGVRLIELVALRDWRANSQRKIRSGLTKRFKQNLPLKSFNGPNLRRARDMSSHL